MKNNFVYKIFLGTKDNLFLTMVYVFLISIFLLYFIGRIVGEAFFYFTH